MAVYISIVSHGHDDFITNNTQLQELIKRPDMGVIIKDNKNSVGLRRYAQLQGYYYLSTDSPAGFGANNNAVYRYCVQVASARAADYLCVLNPDVVVEPNVVAALVEEMQRRELRFATLNLLQDETGVRYDLNIKRFPSVLDFAKGFFFGANPAAYDKAKISEPAIVDWASGAFLLVRFDLYRDLGGFDERFFMYLEDVDICRRAVENFDESLWYFPQYKAVHLCQQANKKLFSKHFWWFLQSMFRYFLKYRFRTRPKKIAL